MAVSSQGEEWSDFNFEIPVGEAGGTFGVDLETGGWGGELCRCPSEHGVGGEGWTKSCHAWTDVRSTLKLAGKSC